MRECLGFQSGRNRMRRRGLVAFEWIVLCDTIGHRRRGRFYGLGLQHYSAAGGGGHFG